MPTKRAASLSLDLDNQWSYMKTHGDAGWEAFPSYLDIVIPRFNELLANFDNQKITVFTVGQDAALEKNHARTPWIRVRRFHLPQLPRATCARLLFHDGKTHARRKRAT